MNTYWLQNREQERQRRVEKGYWLVLITISALTVIAAVILVIVVLVRAGTMVTATPPATAAPDEYITAAYIPDEPEQGPMMAQEQEPAPAPARYDLTAAEREIVEQTVMAEGGNTEDETGLIFIAQCILNACERSGVRPDEAVEIYQYAPPAGEVNEKVMEVVRRVFDLGETVTDEPVLFFYAPRYCESSWHESLGFVAEHGGHRFFKLREDENGL